MNIAAVGQLDRNSAAVFYNTKLQQKMQIKSIYTMNKGLYNRKNQAWPKDGIMMKVGGDSYTEQSVTWKDGLRNAGVYGQAQARNSEEDVRTANLRVYQDNVRKVIPKPGYGRRKLEADRYKLYDQHEQDVVVWNQEQEDYEIQMSQLERYGPNLVDANADASAFCTQWWNPNMFIPTGGINDWNGTIGQPIFSRTRATHTNRIGDVMDATGGINSQLAARTLTAPVCEDLSNWVLAKRISQFRIPGLMADMGVVVTISELQASYFSNPSFASNNLGSYYLSLGQFPDETRMRWPGLIGGYNNLLFVVNPRQPTVRFTGSAPSWGMSAHYMVWNSRDLRLRGNTGVHDTLFVHGENSLVHVEGERIHWVEDDQDYHFRLGVGSALVRGYNLPIYLYSTSTAIEYYGGAVGILDLPNGGSVAS